jgi:thiopeptide-type bacteriocin biosynthesis protein
LIDELWRQTILLTDLRPPLTNVDPAAYLARRLSNIPDAGGALQKLQAARSAMAAWDELPLEEAASSYRVLARSCDGVGDHKLEWSPQVDMALPLSGRHVAEAVGREAVLAAELLLRLTPLPSGPPHLAAYREAFEARFGHLREVPLLELLDPAYGLGSPSTSFHEADPGVDPSKRTLRQQTLNNIALEALRERQLIVELDDETLSRLESRPLTSAAIPTSLDLSLFVLAGSAAELDAGRFEIVVGPNLGGIAAGRNLGRFADLLGDEAETALKELGEAEAALHPEGLWAELVYLPNKFRSANVAVRPHPRGHEIAVGISPGVSPDRVIPLDELVVGVRAGRFYLRWPAREADVIPCAGHMLNNSQAPNVCRFLDELRRDGLAQFSSFDWGTAAGLPVLPRVRVRRVILSPARWRIDSRVKSQLAPDAPRSFSGRLEAWRERWDVPRHIYVASGDNRLLLDLEDMAQAEELRAEVNRLRPDGHLFLQEALPSPDHAWMEGPGGRFIAEFVVPLVLRNDDASSNPMSRPPRVVASAPVMASSTDRLRPPGSDWLFAKLYCPRPLEDDLLIGPVAELCEEILASGAAEDWFFIRYADPDFHIRLRFRGDPEHLVGRVVPQLCSSANRLIREGACSRLCFDTYERELERYGGVAGTAVAEAIFGADSRAVVDMLRLSRSGLLELEMTTLAVLSVDDLLAGLGASEADRLAWYREHISSGSGAGQEYRRLKATLRPLLGDPEYLRIQPGGDALARVLASRRYELAGPCGELHSLAETGGLSQTKMALFSSYVHLHCNRLLSGDRALEEQVLGLLKRTRYGLTREPASPSDLRRGQQSAPAAESSWCVASCRSLPAKGAKMAVLAGRLLVSES